MHRKRYSGPVSVLALLLAIAGALWGASPEPAAAQETVTVPVGDLWFCAESFEDGVCDTAVAAGDTVVWDFSSAFVVHTTTECGASCDNPTDAPLWDSGVIDAGGTFQHTFDQPGAYLYYCEVHPFEMRGRIIVRAAEPTATLQTPIEDGGAAPTATPGGPLPPVGQGPQSGSSAAWLVGALVAGAFGLSAIGAGAYAVARRRR